MAATIDVLNTALTGRYMIDREIGRGGMATVYLARDLRHDRNVALKVLLAELGAILGPDRFLSEIRVTANLQHPNLLPLFDSGEADGRLYYVMPYVEGESVRHRLEREKQLPIDEAVRIATACASALDYAHRNGVIHRDLKPENILLSAGQPVIADFGIALAVRNAGGARITQSGLSLGTPQYMSPEQAAGDREVDGRSDIYSLACVLYEMLTGDPPHTGSTVQAIVAKVLVETPRNVRAQRERVPGHVDAAIECALAKLPADRWATAGKFAEALTDPAITSAARETLAAAGVSAGRKAMPTRTERLSRFLWPAIAMVFAVVAASGWWRATRPARSIPVSFVVPTPPTARLAVDPSAVLFAPDGRSIAYAAAVDGRRRLYARPLTDINVREIPGTDGALLPFFSPDGRWIGYGTEDNMVYRVPALGGTPVQIARLRGWWGGAWNSRGDLVLAGDSGLYILSEGAAQPELITRVVATKQELVHAQPMFLPDGKTILFRIDDRVSRVNNRLGIASIDRKGHELLGINGGNPLAFIDGTLFFGRANGLMGAVPFDAHRGKVAGEPTVVLDEISVYMGAAASFTSNGSLVYVKSSNASRLLMTDERGVASRATTEEARRYFFPRFSPDSRRIAVHASSGGRSRSDIWVYDVESKVLSRLTSQAPSARPEWTPDGRHITYVRQGSGKNEIWRVPADGSGGEEKFFDSDDGIQGLNFSPGGAFAVLQTAHPTTNRDVWILSLDRAGKVQTATPFLTSAFNELSPRVSPDGRWITYISDESGRYEVYVRAFPGSGPRVQVSTNGGTEPVWTMNGSRVVYRSGNNFVVANFDKAAGLTVSSRHELFEDRFLSGLDRPQYDVDGTGKSFVLLHPVGSPEIVVMLDAARTLLSRSPERP